jgi:hypothetical protein
MRAVIGGLRYDTEKAELVGSFASGHETRSFGYYEEALYRTARGAWFLAGRGNARSSYGRSFGNNTWGPGEQLSPLTEDEAQEWLEAHGEVDALETYFGQSLADA